MADVAATLAGWSSTTASNSPSGGTSVGTGLDDNLREIQGVVVRGLSHKGSDIASATTTDIGAVEGLMHDITGTTTITGLGTVRAGIIKVLKFEGALTLTHNATSLILPGGANITTADGDVAVFISEGSGTWRCVDYAGRASAAEVLAGTEASKAITPAAFAGNKDISGAAGYYKLPGGLIFQWDEVTTNATGDVTWTFPTAFSTACFYVGAQVRSGDTAQMASIATPTTTSVAVSVRAHDDSQPSTVILRVFAVGV
jgi:hypothetical protein